MTRLSKEEPRTALELRSTLRRMGFGDDYSLAVEGLVFDQSGRWILMERGSGAQDENGKLEGIGGGAKGDGDLRAELHREIREEAGSAAVIEIVGFLEVKSDYVTKVLPDGKTAQKTWVIASYICAHRSGELEVAEPEKNAGFLHVRDLDVEPQRLSSSCQQSLVSLREDWPNVAATLAAATSSV